MGASRWVWTGSAVLFDMDGTLVDSGGSVPRAWRWLAAEGERPDRARLRRRPARRDGDSPD
ncbi:MAG: hypothetical protein ACR2N4_09335 [Jatrophihabitans sp.]